MFVKAVYSFIQPPKFLYISINQGPYGLVYEPGVWVAPKLPGSRLFVFEKLDYAVWWYGKPEIKELPYQGITLWTVEVLDARRIDVLKGPPARIVKLFWQLHKKGISPYSWQGKDFFSWMYKYKDQPDGVYAANEVRLMNIMGPDDWKGMSVCTIDR